MLSIILRVYFYDVFAESLYDTKILSENVAVEVICGFDISGV